MSQNWLQRAREKTAGMKAGEIAGEVLLRARHRLSRRYRQISDRRDTTFITEGQMSRALAGEDLADVAAQVRAGHLLCLTPGLQHLSRTAEIVRQSYPEAVEEARRAAEAIVGHRITLFNRPFDLGPEIDWHADPGSGVRWPFEHYTRMPVRVGNGSDVRVVWELNRLHHFVALGRAYALTGDDRYTEEFLLQFASWYERNPPRFGVNWMVAMEAGIRAVNLITALQLFRASPLLTDEAIDLILRGLLAHGRFIRANLEFSYRIASNHYLSDLIGLFAIGMAAPFFRESARWASDSAEALLVELDRQVYPDGVDYEGATAYHRLVLEIYALFFALCRAGGIEVPAEHWKRLHAMFDFVRHYLKPDGRAPVIGDSDDGRIMKFRERPAADHTYLMPLAAILLESEVFKASSRLDEEAVWWFGEQGRDAFESLTVNEEPPQSKAFEAAQIYVQRQGDLYAIIDCGDHGARGRGSHAHSDALSLELYAYGQTFLRDPGTFIYTASPRWRNQFRSTAYHNTVRVDGREISRFNEDELFAMGPNLLPRVTHWHTSEEQDVLSAEHDGYADLGITHHRTVIFDKRAGQWIIEDRFSGAGEHEFEYFFIFDVGVEVSVEDELRIVARAPGAALEIIAADDPGFEARIETRWVSPAYGTRLRAAGVVLRLRAEAPLHSVFKIVPAPAAK